MRRTFDSRRLCVRLASLVVLSLTGCGLDQAAAPNASQPAAAGTSNSGSTSASATKIKLSAGVALGQTTPEGTMMSFSVDYRFLEGGPSKDARYAWVIQPTRGEPLAQAVKLRREDTLQSFVPQWKPENGPFTSQIDELLEDGTRRPLSQPINMR